VLQPNNAGEMVITRLVPNGPAEQSAKVLRRVPRAILSASASARLAHCDMCPGGVDLMLSGPMAGAGWRCAHVSRWHARARYGKSRKRQHLRWRQQGPVTYCTMWLSAGWKMADILRMIVGDDETFVTLGLTRHGEGFSTSIKRSAKPMPAGHTPVLSSSCMPCRAVVNLPPARHVTACGACWTLSHANARPGFGNSVQAAVAIPHTHILQPASNCDSGSGQPQRSGCRAGAPPSRQARRADAERICALCRGH